MKTASQIIVTIAVVFACVPVARAAFDLVITSIDAPSTLDVGEYVTSMYYTVQNQGDSQACPRSYLWINGLVVLFSRDDQWNGGDLQLYPQSTEFGWGCILGPGESGTGRPLFFAPATWGRGDYYLIVVVDPGNDFPESNEQNNVRSVPVRIRQSDLVVTDITAPTHVAVGKGFSFSWTIQNHGDGKAIGAFGSSWDDRVYLSNDDQLSSDDACVLIKREAAANVLPGESYTASHYAWINKAGDYYLIVKADDRGRYTVNESNEENNVLSKLIRVGLWTPVVSTSPATDVTKHSTTLNGSVTDDGGEACQYRFRYREEKGDYLYTAWTGSVTTGQSFGEAISDLKPNGMYYFSAQAKNSLYESAWGYEQIFVARPGEAPKGSFKYEPQKPRPGQTIVFDASKSEDKDGWIDDYRWDFGDGTSGSTSSPGKSYAQPGEYLVRLVVTDNDGLVGTATSIVKVKDKGVVYDPWPPEAVEWNKNGHWYEVVVAGPEGISWPDAQAAAVARGGHLATIASSEENEFVFNLTGSKQGAWIYSAEWAIGPWLGGSDAASEGDWQWVTGEPWGYSNWLAGQPDDWQDENYLLYWGLGDIAPTWNDGDVAPSYVIEYELGMPAPVQWEQNGHWYQVVVGSDLMSWADAQDAAAAKGGYLATIASAEENAFVFNLTVSTPKAWIYSPQWAIGPWLGGNDAASEGNWQWVTGEPWGYANWLAGQPDNWGDEDYLLYWGDWDPASTWSDGVLAPGYVIEYDPDALMGGGTIDTGP